MTKSRSYVFTLNNYTQEDEVYLQTVLQFQYIVYGREIAPSTGTPHLQGYVYFSNPRSFESVRKLRKWSIQVAKADALKNGEYTKKGDDWFEKGDRPLTQTEKGNCERDRYKRAFDSALEGNLLNIDSDILIRHYNTLKRLKCEFTSVRTMDRMPLCVYVWGETGCGKSHIAEENWGENLYHKEPLTKWFSGYEHEKVIWIEEIEPLSRELQSLYKRLCDKYVCAVETKFGNLKIRPEIIYITSNHSPSVVFGGALVPMLRRLNVFNITQENARQIQARVKELVEAYGRAGAPQGGQEGLHFQQETGPSSSS